MLVKQWTHHNFLPGFTAFIGTKDL